MNSIDCAKKAYELLREARHLLNNINTDEPEIADILAAETLVVKINALLIESPVVRSLEGAT